MACGVGRISVGGTGSVDQKDSDGNEDKKEFAHVAATPTLVDSIVSHHSSFGVCGVLLTSALGGVRIPLYEHLAWGAHWWRYQHCLLFWHVPVYIVVAEAVIGIGLALLGYLILSGGSWRTAVPLGAATGVWMILGGVVGWGTVEFLGRHARPLWPFP